MTAVGIDWQASLDHVRDAVQTLCPVQGNLDPMRLVIGGEGMERAIDRILSRLGGGPLIFNLGHGITPDAPVEHVEQMIARVRKG